MIISEKILIWVFSRIFFYYYLFFLSWIFRNLEIFLIFSEFLLKTSSLQTVTLSIRFSSFICQNLGQIDFAHYKTRNCKLLKIQQKVKTKKKLFSWPSTGFLFIESVFQILKCIELIKQTINYMISGLDKSSIHKKFFVRFVEALNFRIKLTKQDIISLKILLYLVLVSRSQQNLHQFENFWSF